MEAIKKLQVHMYGLGSPLKFNNVESISIFNGLYIISKRRGEICRIPLQNVVLIEEE